MSTKKRHFDIFKREVERWVRHFGLTNWSVSIMHYKASESAHSNIVESGSSAVAWVGFTEYGNQVATVCLNKEYNDGGDLGEEELSRAAFHEVGHIMLRNLYCLACMRFNVSEDTIAGEEHALISVLENTVWRGAENEKIEHIGQIKTKTIEDCVQGKSETINVDNGVEVT